jgi:hypothetical protein
MSHFLTRQVTSHVFGPDNQLTNAVADGYYRSPDNVFGYVAKQMLYTGIFIIIVLFVWVVIFRKPVVLQKKENFENEPQAKDESDGRCSTFTKI